jgi:hypothetical protein
MKIYWLIQRVVYFSPPSLTKTPVVSSTYSSEVEAGEGGRATVVAGGTPSSFPPVCDNHMNFIEILDSVQALNRRVFNEKLRALGSLGPHSYGQNRCFKEEADPTRPP